MISSISLWPNSEFCFIFNFLLLDGLGLVVAVVLLLSTLKSSL